MELWIRSKSNKRLVKANFIEIGNLEYANGDVDIMVNDMGFGRYSKERALEVLDEIQNILMPKISYTPVIEEIKNPSFEYKHFTTKSAEVEIMELSTYVYQMPKE